MSGYFDKIVNAPSMEEGVIRYKFGISGLLGAA